MADTNGTGQQGTASRESWNDTQRIIAFVVVVAFILVIVCWMFYPPKGDPNTIAVLNTLVGSLGTMTMIVVGYYFSSTKGSQAKDSTSNAQAQALAALTAPPAAPTPPAAPPAGGP